MEVDKEGENSLSEYMPPFIHQETIRTLGWRCTTTSVSVHGDRGVVSIWSQLPFTVLRYASTYVYVYLCEFTFFDVCVCCKRIVIRRQIKFNTANVLQIGLRITDLKAF